MIGIFAKIRTKEKMNKEYFLSRRSCRLYSTEQIDNKEINDIIQQASKAPTCGNMQLYSVIITRDEENRKLLAAQHFNQPAALTAPVILTICADFNRFTKWCQINDADAGYDNFHSFITAMTDAVIFAQQIVTIAELKGFGTCYLGTVTYNAKEISSLLKLPELVVPVASLALGVPEKEGESTERLPIKALIHDETYRVDSEEVIKEFFRIHDDNKENIKFIEENGKGNLAQVFAEVRYPRALNEEVSKSFHELLQNKGFIK